MFSHLVFGAHGEDVMFTMVDGDVLVENGEVTTVDSETIRQQADDVGLSLESHREAAKEVKP